MTDRTRINRAEAHAWLVQHADQLGLSPGRPKREEALRATPAFCLRFGCSKRTALRHIAAFRSRRSAAEARTLRIEPAEAAMVRALAARYLVPGGGPIASQPPPEPRQRPPNASVRRNRTETMALGDLLIVLIDRLEDRLLLDLLRQRIGVRLRHLTPERSRPTTDLIASVMELVDAIEATDGPLLDAAGRGALADLRRAAAAMQHARQRTRQ